ncbi:hypothetical protein SLEP1_g3030 [Rubroshorea leprosula]|uniref:Uncharacterized protein n=1 Tax=Rubroshorea leprosula TaxID=152421 RepID=A0AAV5HQI6_9ROSI|nr:hypothetical protein SLEP1_g3030 [Rubroshorea leprosula]
MDCCQEVLCWVLFLFTGCQGQALTNPQISSNCCAHEGWVVSEPFDVVPSLRPSSLAVSTVSQKHLFGVFEPFVP